VKAIYLLSVTCLFAASAAAADPAPVPVTAAIAQGGDVPIIREGLGTVQALNSATIRVQVSGMLQQIAFKEGQFVKQGQLLAQIDPRPFQAQVDQAVAMLARDKATLANARLDLSRTKPLATRGYATDQQLDTQSSTVEQGESTLKIDEAQIEAAKVQLGFTTITAPFDGIVGIRLIDVGNVVHPTDANGLVVLTQVQPISVLFSLPSSDIPSIQAALKRGPVDVIAFASDDKTILDKGTLLLVNNTADPTSGTVQLKAQFPNADERLWPGTFVNAHVTVEVRKNGVTVPLASVQQGPKGPYVYIVGNDDIAHIHEVKVGQSYKGQVLIDDGLRGGERVVTDGQYGLTEGVKVTVMSGDASKQVQSSTSASAGMLP